MVTTAKKPIQKICIECSQSIPSAARKCSKCGSFQDWRRLVTSGQNTLALIISLLALGTTVVLYGQSISKHVQSTVFPEANLRFGIANIDAREASLVVTNPTSRPTVINSLSCTIWVPIGREWLGRSEMGLRQDVWPKKEESMGVFLVSYRPQEAIMLPAGAQQAFIAPIDHIAPPRPHGETVGLAHSGCFLGSMNDGNELVVGAAMLNPNDLTAFDALAMVEAADYSPLQQDQYVADKARIVAYPESPSR